jgi:hypothetical protein
LALRGERSIEGVVLEHRRLMVVGAEHIAETLGRNDMRMLLADGAELGGVPAIFEALSSIAAKNREPRVRVEECVCDPFELKGGRVLATLTQHVYHLTADPDSKTRAARRSLREHLPKETFGTHGIESFAFHELWESYFCVREKDAVGGIDGRAVPPGTQALGDSLKRAGPRHQDERIARARTLGEEFRNRIMEALLVFIELDGVTSGSGP